MPGGTGAVTDVDDARLNDPRLARVRRGGLEVEAAETALVPARRGHLLLPLRRIVFRPHPLPRRRLRPGRSAQPDQPEPRAATRSAFEMRLPVESTADALRLTLHLDRSRCACGLPNSEAPPPR